MTDAPEVAEFTSLVKSEEEALNLIRRLKGNASQFATEFAAKVDAEIAGFGRQESVAAEEELPASVSQPAPVTQPAPASAPAAPPPAEPAGRAAAASVVPTSVQRNVASDRSHLLGYRKGSDGNWYFCSARFNDPRNCAYAPGGPTS